MNRNAKFWMFPLLILLLSGPAFAQGGNSDAQGGRLLMELERTDETIDQANEAYRVSNRPLAGVALEAAVKLQTEAWIAYRDNELVKAGLLTGEARKQARKSLNISRLSEQNEAAVQRQLEKVQELLDRLAESYQSRNDTEMSALYFAARENYGKAMAFYREQQYKPAIQLGLQIEQTLRKLWQTANQRENDSNRYQQRYEKALELYNQVRSEITDCDQPSALELMNQAREMLDKSTDAAANDNYRAAIRQYNLARKMMLQADRQCGSTERLQNRYDRLSELIADLSEDLDPGDQRARQQLDQARRQLKQAAEFIEKGDSQSAAAALKAAQLTLERLGKD